MIETKIKTLKELKLDNFVKFTDKDKKGKFSYIGKIIKIDEEWVIIETFEGIMGFKICTENDLMHADEPSGWTKFTKNPEKFRQDIKNKEKQKDIAPEVKTQKQLIMEFVRDNKKLKKNKLLSLLKKQFPAMDENKLLIQLDLCLLKG